MYGTRLRPRHATHRHPTDADEPSRRRVRRPPRLRTQAAAVALVPVLVWALAHPAVVLAAVATLALAAVVAGLARLRRRPARRPSPSAE